jgi:hypothetical protein
MCDANASSSNNIWVLFKLETNMLEIPSEP